MSARIISFLIIALLCFYRTTLTGKQLQFLINAIEPALCIQRVTNSLGGTNNRMFDCTEICSVLITYSRKRKAIFSGFEIKTNVLTMIATIYLLTGEKSTYLEIKCWHMKKKNWIKNGRIDIKKENST